MCILNNLKHQTMATDSQCSPVASSGLHTKIERQHHSPQRACPLSLVCQNRTYISSKAGGRQTPIGRETLWNSYNYAVLIHGYTDLFAGAIPIHCN